MRTLPLLAVLLLCAGGAASAQPAPAAAGPVVGADASWRVTVRAVRLNAPLILDGQLDEAVYRDTPAITEFILAEPRAGVPPSQKTEA